MLPSSHKPLRQRRQAGINIKQSICLVVAAAALFLLTATILYGTMPEHQSLSHLRHTASGLATAAKSKVTAAKSAAANTAAAAAAATGSVLTNAASSAKQAVRSGANSVSRFAERGKINRARALAECKDQQATCAQWAHAGECTNNPGFMRPNCPKSCDACLDSLKRQELCHRPRSRMPLLRRGGVDATFERLLEQMAAEGFVVHTPSRPPTGPWVVYIDDFLAEHEIRALMEKGGHHFERSLAGDGVSPVRTSKTSWCNVPFCEADPTIRSLKNRVANVTGVPLANSEHVQVLQYDPGDFYRQHHDQNAHPLSPWGPRLYTFFLYLSNVAEGVGSSTDQPLPCPRSLNMACVASTLPPLRLEPDLISSSSDLIRSTQPATVPTSPPVYAPPVWQGGTRFTHLNITVEAKRGRALFWPSVLNSDPSAVRISSDHRTTHEALTVTKGQKFAANMWLHQFDFQNTLAAGCRNEDQASWRPSSVEEADERYEEEAEGENAAATEGQPQPLLKA